MKSLPCFGLFFVFILITDAYAKICFLADPNCQIGSNVANILDQSIICKEKNSEWIKESEKCEYMLYSQVCSDKTGNYYKATGCVNGYTDMTDKAQEKFTCKSSLKCGHCCLNEDVYEKSDCQSGYYLSNGSCIACQNIVTTCPAHGNCADMSDNKKCLISCSANYMISESQCVKKPNTNGGGGNLCGTCKKYMCATNSKCYSSSSSCYSNCGKDYNSGKTVCVDCSNNNGFYDVMDNVVGYPEYELK